MAARCSASAGDGADLGTVIVIASATLVAGFGCGSADRRPATIADSAGVRLVTNRGGEGWRSGSPWTGILRLRLNR